MQVYDQMNNAGSWSIGSRMDQMLEDCGPLCEDGGCAIAMGDVNEDEIIDNMDIILIVNMILYNLGLTETQHTLADLNFDDIINIFDIYLLAELINNNLNQ